MKYYTSLSQIQQDLKDANLHLTNLVRFYINQIENQKHLNAFLEVFEEDALKQAQEISDKIASGKSPGKLYGLVIAIKDNICYKNHKISASSKILENFESLYSATVVERLLAEDAIIIGRTNCDEFAMGSSNETSAYGKVKNALDETRVPGGSSGGSAVAVQANMCLASLGSETGGSVRQPASFCGLVGFKPTYGRISRHGLIAYASSFDQIGVFTKNMADLAAILQVIAGEDEFDSTVSSVKVDNYPARLSDENKTYKIAYFDGVIDNQGIEPEVNQAYKNWLKQLENDGHQLEKVSFSMMETLIPSYYVLTTAEASSNLARFDGMRYGFRSKTKSDIDNLYKNSRTEGFGTEVKNRIMLGTFVLSSGFYDAYYTQAQKVRRKLVNEIDAIFDKYDFIALPSVPEVAFRFGEKSDNPVKMYYSDLFTVLANLLGCPAISLPLYHGAHNLPVGMQLMSAKFEESKLLSFSNKLLSAK